MLQTSCKGEWFEITVPKQWENLTIDDVFRKIWKSPKKLTHTFRMEKKVQLNGKFADWNAPLIPGSKMMLNFFENKMGDIPPLFIEIPILYEDEHFIIFNKPPFMNSHPNDMATEKDTLLNAAAAYLQTKGEIRAVRHIHRLDRDTTGAILFAKHALAGAIADWMLQERRIKRTYIAIAHGLFSSKRGTIQEPIGRDRHHATRRRVSKTGQEAITHYQVIKEEKKQKLSYVKCWLDTGRTHQIRVHLSHIGHPLAGDVLYGGKRLFNRQALHAVKLEFVHPFTEEQIICHAPFIDTPLIFTGVDVNSI